MFVPFEYSGGALIIGEIFSHLLNDELIVRTTNL